MSDSASTSTALDPALLDRMVPDYRAFVESQTPARRVPFHTLTWSPAFRQIPGPPPDLGQSDAVPVGSTRTIQLYDGRFSVRVLTPEGETPSEGWPVLVFFHGGGFVFGTVESGSPFYSRACVDAKCVVVSVDYRLAPEHPFPAAVDDCWDALLWVIGAGKNQIGADPSRVAVGGVSAGGTLAAVIAQRASRSRIPICLQILAVPLTNATFSAADREVWPPSMVEHQNAFSLRALDMLWLRDLYIPKVEDRVLPDASPILEDDKSVYEGMASAWVGVMELDILRSEGEMYAEKMKRFGVDVTLKVYKGVTHLAVAADRVCETSRTMREDQIEALKVAFSK